MSINALSTTELSRALALRDLTDPSHGPHAMQVVLDELVAALARVAPVRVHRASPIVSIADNYDRLGYAADAIARDARYTRYACDVAVLRTQTSAMIPPLLRALARELDAPDDVLLVCPGLVYRRDAIDRLHVGEPHQVDVWRVARMAVDSSRAALTARELDELIAIVVAAVLPDARWRTQPASHPYTIDGVQIDVEHDGAWIEIGECGVASPRLYAASGLGDRGGLALGLGLDRIVMLRKRVPDIRLLRASDARIARQMLDLAPYRAVSAMPAVRRDLSIALAPPVDPERLGDDVRRALGDRAELVEQIEVLAVTPCAELPPAARARLGIADDQHNALVRVTLRAVDRTLTDDECNALRDDVYAAIHRGTAQQWARRPPADP
jgi:phenylalanyl-tRNA synthetase alpha chain